MKYLFGSLFVHINFSTVQIRLRSGAARSKIAQKNCYTNYAVPTGALDSKAADALLKLFGQINSEGQTILMVTHSTKAASHAKRVLFIKDGEVFHQIYRGNMSSQEMFEKISNTLTILTTGGEYNA